MKIKVVFSDIDGNEYDEIVEVAGNISADALRDIVTDITPQQGYYLCWYGKAR